MALPKLDKQNKKKGYITLISVIVLGAMAILVVTTNLSVSTNSVLSISSVEKHKKARALADTCIEYALNTLKTNNAYTGNQTLVLTFGSCTIGTISGTGNTNRSFQASSTYGEETSKIEVIINQINPSMDISSWKEVE